MVSRTHGTTDREQVDEFLASRSEHAFRLLYRRHCERLYSLLVRLLGRDSSEAEELFQETWVRIVEALSGFAWRSSFATWTAGIALNCVREWRRSRARPRDGEPAEVEDPRAAIGRVQTTLDLDEALARLPDGYREVLVLHDVHGHTHEEIGELLTISSGTSKSQLSRARRAVRRLLDDEESDA